MITDYLAACEATISANLGGDFDSVHADMEYSDGRDLHKSINLDISQRRSGPFADADVHLSGYELVGEVFHEIGDAYPVARAWLDEVTEKVEGYLEAIEGSGGVNALQIVFGRMERNGTLYAVAAMIWRAPEA